jgi:hypothetical protein
VGAAREPSPGRALDRTQQTLWFKIAASIAVVVISAGLLLYFAVEAPAAQGPQRVEPTVLNTENIPRGRDPAEQAMIDRTIQIERDREVQFVRMVNDLLAAQTSIADRTSIILVVAGVAIVVIWIGVALTYLAIMLAGAVVVVPLVRVAFSPFRPRSAGSSAHCRWRCHSRIRSPPSPATWSSRPHA